MYVVMATELVRQTLIGVRGVFGFSRLEMFVGWVFGRAVGVLGYLCCSVVCL